LKKIRIVFWQNVLKTNLACIVKKNLGYFYTFEQMAYSRE